MRQQKYKKNKVLMPEIKMTVQKLLEEAKQNDEVYTVRGLASEVYGIPLEEFTGRVNNMERRASIAFQSTRLLLKKMMELELVVEHRDTLIKQYVYELR